MKKAWIFLVLVPHFLWSQITTNPSIPTANKEVTIIFDATDTELDGYTGEVYAHTGVEYNGNDWQNVIGTWGDNDAQPELTRDGSNPNLYTLTISPDIHTYYGVDNSITITALWFVIRSADGSKQTRPDISIAIFEEGLNILINQPDQNDIISLFESISIEAESSVESDMELFVNDISIKSTTNTTTITKTNLFTTAGWHTIKATASVGGETKETTVDVFVKENTQNEALPVGASNGVNINNDNSVTLVLLAPHKSDVFLLGDFNDYKIEAPYQMKKDDDYFWITLNGLDIDKEYGYQYLVDGEIKIADPYSEKILDPNWDHEISAAIYPDLKEYPDELTSGYVSTFKINETDYTWEIENFDRADKDKLVIYELLIRDFTEASSFNAALQKLDYLENLGINAIELMPVNEFEANNSWGYNPALYMALDKAYGTKNDFKKFVDECHKRGIAVLADVVFNHSFGSSPLLHMYWDSSNNQPAANSPFYNENHNLVDNTNAHWGFDFNHESQYTVNFFKDVLDYWMTEYKIDGFRFDFTKGMSNTLYYGENNWASAYDADRIAILKDYADHVWNHDLSDKPYVIFEHLSENAEEKELANHGILLWGNMNHSFNQNTMGYSSDADISWISYKQRGWNQKGVVGYMESHDEERLMYKNLEFGANSGNYNVKDLTTALSREEAAGIFLFAVPGPKMIWQFGELGYEFSINSDENGVVHYNNDGSVNTSYRTHKKPVRWDYAEDAKRKQIFNTWATMLAFKKNYEEVFNTSDFSMSVAGLQKSIILRHSSMDVIILGNFDVSTKTVSFTFTETGDWFEYFSGNELDITNTSASFSLKPGEYRIYTSKRVTDPRGGTSNEDSDGDGITDDIDQCPNTYPGIEVGETGCPLFTLPSDNFTIEVIGETCPDKNNGQLIIDATETHNYSVRFNETDFNFTSSLEIDDIEPGTYEFCITVDGETYEQCFSVTVEEGSNLLAKSAVSGKTLTVAITQGTAPFDVLVNGHEVLRTSFNTFDIPVEHGDEILVKTAVDCEGVHAKTIALFDQIIAYPNPTYGAVEIVVPVQQNSVAVDLFSIDGKLISSKEYTINAGKVQLNLANQPNGLYLATVKLEQPTTVKIIKQ